MSEGTSTFKAAMIQMRSGLTPHANIDAAVRMIGEAKAAGADYVLTPEMTNILAAKREQLFSAIVEEERDTSRASSASMSMSARWRSSSAKTASPTAPS
jgi:predicted amidohydrolase